MNPPPYFWLYQAAFLLQAPALLLFLAYAWQARRALSLTATGLLSASLALHLLFTALSASADGRLPLASGFEALSLWGLALTGLVVWVEWRHQLGLLGAFLSPLSLLTLLMGFRFAQADAQPVPGLQDWRLLVHVALAMAAYALFTGAAGVAGAYLVQERQLKAKRMARLLYQLPSLQELEGLLARLILAGVSALGLGLLAGFAWRLSYDGSLGLDDPKVGFSLGVGALYGLALALRRRGAIGGRRLAWLALLTFVLLFLGYYLVNLYLGGHGFLKTAGGR
jgi:ABC-type transport system involved in cytochrome c biogenesis permease subunit